MNSELTAIVFIAGVCAFLGLIFLIVGTAMLRSAGKKKKTCTEKTTGTVTEMVFSQHAKYSAHSKKDPKRLYKNKASFNPVYHPVFEYQVGKARYIKEHSFGHHKPQFYEGEGVVICYNPKYPNEFYLPGYKSSTASAVIFVIAGIVLLLLGAAVPILHINNII